MTNKFTNLEYLYFHLKDKNLNPYFIGQHKGLADKEYLVIKKSNIIPWSDGGRLNQQIIDIILFTPANSYIKLDKQYKRVIAAIKEFNDKSPFEADGEIVNHRNWLRKTGAEGPDVIDDDKKAYTRSIEYIIQKTEVL